MDKFDEPSPHPETAEQLLGRMRAQTGNPLAAFSNAPVAPAGQRKRKLQTPAEWNAYQIEYAMEMVHAKIKRNKKN